MKSAFFTDYHRPRIFEDTPPLVQCDSCEHWCDADCVRTSKLTGETYCSEGIGNCWELAEQAHNEEAESILNEHEATKFE